MRARTCRRGQQLRAWAHHRRRWLWGTLGVLMILSAVGVAARNTSVLDSTQRDQRATQRDQAAQGRQLAALAKRLGDEHTQLIEGCNRLQIQRVDENISHFSDFNVYRSVLVESIASEKRMHLTAEQIRDSDVLLDPIRAAIAAKTWVPVTNCTQAVNAGGVHYAIPLPIKFTSRLPRCVDLTLPGFQPDPKGPICRQLSEKTA